MPPKWLAAVVLAVFVLAIAFVTASYLSDSESGPSGAGVNIKELEAAVRADPESLQARLSLAQGYMGTENFEDALTQFQEVLKIDSENEEALLGAGVSHLELEQTEDAVQAFVTIVSQNKENPYAKLNQRLETAHYYLGRIYRDQGLLQESINELRLALEINRADADVLYELGLSFQASAMHEDALSAFEMALAFVPDYLEAYEGMRDAARALGAEKKAAYAEALMLVFDGDVKEGAKRLEALAENSEDSRVWWALGYAQEQLGETDAAVEAYQRAVEINPGERLAADALVRLSGPE
ncbi:MAG: hypothetical protein A2Z17_04710 [Gammaproteobacteria bacterium RBG_16_66_13]|nr:MAG: hypothetical protein A2Z17_04710 [Gammaproteobacteria bacterium RBG_16_66_13]